MVTDPARHGELSDADRAILVYVGRLTEAPAAVSADDVAALRAHGFSDRAVLDICQITAYFGFVNRLVEGLGVVLEPTYEDPG